MTLRRILTVFASDVRPVLLLTGLVPNLLACSEDQEPPAHSSQSEVAFPTHDEPLPTDRGNSHIAGELVMEDSCLSLNIDTIMGQFKVDANVLDEPASPTL